MDEQENEYTVLIPDFKGSYIVYSQCENCKQIVRYPTERPYNVCPYCGKRVIYKEEE